jgi:hypothetical protein
MAGDWIKMRTDLAEDPSVIYLSAKLGIDEDTVVGKLHRLWSWADRQTADGNAVGVTLSWIDRYTNQIDFAKTLIETGWLLLNGEVLSFPNFERHNGKSAKIRALTKNRVSTKRSKECNAVSVTSALPEKRREELNTPLSPPRGFDTSEANEPASSDVNSGTGSSGSACDPIREAEFERFWSAYPPRKGRKVGKAEARIAFAKVNASEIEILIRAAGNYAEHCRTKDDFPKDAKRFISCGRGSKVEPWRDWVEVEKVEVNRLTPKEKWKKQKYCPG